MAKSDYFSPNGARPLLQTLVRAENLSWRINNGLAPGDAVDFDLWLQRFCRRGEAQADHVAPPQVTVKRPSYTLRWWDHGDYILAAWECLPGYYYCIPAAAVKEMPVIWDYEPIDSDTY